MFVFDDLKHTENITKIVANAKFHQNDGTNSEKMEHFHQKMERFHQKMERFLRNDGTNVTSLSIQI